MYWDLFYYLRVTDSGYVSDMLSFYIEIIIWEGRLIDIDIC